MLNTSFVGGIRRIEPHILTVYGKHPFYLEPSQKGIWRRGTPFDEDEEQLQYLSFTQPFNLDTILRPIHSWDDGNGGIAKNRKAQHSDLKLPDQDCETKTNSVQNKGTLAAGQSNQILQIEGGGNRKTESSVDVSGSGPAQERSGSWIMNTIASLGKGTAELPRKEISLADFNAKPRACQQCRNISGKSNPKQETVMAGVDKGKLGEKRPIEDVVGSDTKDTTNIDTPYPDAKRARSSQKPGVIPNGHEKEPRATVDAWAAPIVNSMGSTRITQGGASTAGNISAARSHGEQKFGEKATKQRNFGSHQPSRKENTSLPATKAAAKAVGSEHEARARKRPLEDVTGTDTSKAEPATKKRAIGERRQLAVDNQRISSESKILAPKIIKPNRSAPKTIGSARHLPPLLSPTLPDWVEEEVTKRQAGATAPRSNLAPLWTDQEFGENVASTSVAIGEPLRPFKRKIHALEGNQRPRQAPENTRSTRDLPPLLSPTLPDWIEAEITKRKAAVATAPKSTLAPLCSDQEFAKNTRSPSVSIKRPQRATKLMDSAIEGSKANSKPTRSRISAAPKAPKPNLFIEFLRRGKRFG